MDRKRKFKITIQRNQNYRGCKYDILRSTSIISIYSSERLLAEFGSKLERGKEVDLVNRLRVKDFSSKEEGEAVITGINVLAENHNLYTDLYLRMKKTKNRFKNLLENK